MMHICHVMAGDLWAGAEVMAWTLMKGLSGCSDLAITAIVFNDGRLAGEIRKRGIPVTVLDETKCNPFLIGSEIRKMLEANPVDIIHTHGYKENIICAYATGFGKKSTLIATQHGLPEVYGRIRDVKYRSLSMINRLVLRKSYRYTVGVSIDIKRVLIEKKGFDKRKVECIHNGIELPDVAFSNWQPTGNGLVIGSSGRLSPVKDYALMVDVARHVSMKKDDIRFELAGEGPEKSRILSIIEQYGLSNQFALKGFMSQISSFYEGLDFYINTSLHEGIPMSVLEAMAHGLPVVAPRVGGLVEIVEDGRNGYLIDGRNPEDFAEKCLLLSKDHSLRRRLAQAARKTAETEFSVGRMIDRYHQLYLSAQNNMAICSPAS